MIPVSILTVTQKSRLEFLKILAKCIKKQTYKNIKEWIILDTTGDMKEDISKLKANVKIVYRKSESKIKTIGAWRNEINKNIKGEIIVCMDDDDFYPPNRVKHAVSVLKDKEYLIAAVDNILLYDIHFNKLFQYKSFSRMHGTNNTFAYWKEYLNNHKYNDEDKKAEEDYFTFGFTERIAKLNPKDTVVNISHDENTFNKKIIIYQNVYRDPQQQYIIERIETFRDLVNDHKIYKMYEEIFRRKKRPKPPQYDVVYFCGGFSIEWDPKDKELRGSEQAVIHLSRELVKLGKSVIVYGNIANEQMVDGVIYSNYINFQFWNNFKTIIFWRYFGILPFIAMNINAKMKIVDLHDNTPNVYQIIKNNIQNVDLVMTKSPFHKTCLEKMTGTRPNILCLENGVRKDLFKIDKSVKKEKYRFCYVNCYGRGLIRILESIWPIIKKNIPEAELHIYTGIDPIFGEQFVNKINSLLKQPGVFEYGRQPVEVIVKEKQRANFHLYYTDSPVETDCISIKESLCCGCIPIISNINVFANRNGIQLRWLDDTPENNLEIANTIIKLVDVDLEDTREKLIENNLLSWADVANLWFKFI